MTKDKPSRANEFFQRIKGHSNWRNIDFFQLAIYYYTAELSKEAATTKNVKSFYTEVGIVAPSNFGGEISQLKRAKKITKLKQGYCLTVQARKYIKAALDGSPGASSKNKYTTAPINVNINSLHARIQEVSKQLYIDGHLASAVFEAYKAVVNAVKSVSGLSNLDGKPLMETAFSINNPVIALNPLQTQSDKDEQVGFMFLFSGAALGIRNPKAHDNVIQKDQKRALEYLLFASLLMERLDERNTP